MKFSERWLHEWVHPNVSTQELADQLSMAGLEVDSVTAVAPPFSLVKVGEILDVWPHPDAKRLNCCSVNVGGEPLSIVCGGINVRKGLKVAVAVVGAELPGNIHIHETTIRGALSQGMICSAKELGIEDTVAVEGHIWELSSDAPIGEDVRQYLQLDDQVIDIDLTPNRGDCLSIRGLSREVAVLNQVQWNDLKVHHSKVAIKQTLDIQVLDPNLCSHYVGRIIRNIDPKAQTPLWMQEKLKRSAIRPVRPVVDVCNYVMLELGQPMHAFDLDTLEGNIEVRKSNANEKIKLLNGVQLVLDEGALVIADQNQAHALAGIMGGELSAVSDQTQHLFLESAYFDPLHIQMTARRYAVQSDAVYRYSRGVDCELQNLAMERATELLLQIVKGEAGPLIVVKSEKDQPKFPRIRLRKHQISRWLGVTIESHDVERILSSLGMDVRSHQEDWDVQPPSYRFDIQQEADLIEEIARVYGYNSIPTHQIELPLVAPAMPENHTSQQRLNYFWMDRGYQEVVTYSFIEHTLQQALNPSRHALRLKNPIASDMSEMRTSLWPGLIQVLQYNMNRQMNRLRLFEIGGCFAEVNGEIQEEKYLAAVAVGSAYPLQWGLKKREVDFYDLKGELEALFSLTGFQERFQWHSGTHEALHPGQSADIYFQGRKVGVLGALHPKLVDQFQFPSVPMLLEIEYKVLSELHFPQYQSITKYPGIRRDVALIVDEQVAVQEIINRIQDGKEDLLKEIQIFDIYQGENIELGKKSVALGLTFQDPSRTLVDEEVNTLIKKIISDLEQKFDAKLRA